MWSVKQKMSDRNVVSAHNIIHQEMSVSTLEEFMLSFEMNGLYGHYVFSLQVGLSSWKL